MILLCVDTLYSLRLASEQFHELLTSLCLIESSAERTGGRDRVLLLHTTHLHTHVLRFDNDHCSQRLQSVLDAVLDLFCKSFLYLKSMTEDVYYTSDLA